MFFQYRTDGWPTIEGYRIIVPNRGTNPRVNDYSVIQFVEFQSGEQMIEAGLWADEFLEHEWLIGYMACGFKNANDAMKFKLRWG